MEQSEIRPGTLGRPRRQIAMPRFTCGKRDQTIAISRSSRMAASSERQSSKNGVAVAFSFGSARA